MKLNNNTNELKSYNGFFSKLILANLNGAYLFNEVETEKLDKIAKVLSTNEITLRNSNLDFWDKKIKVNNLGSEVGVSVEIITQSKELNTILERKIDDLVFEYKTAYKDLELEKLNTVYSDAENGKVLIGTSYSKFKLAIRIFLFMLLSALIVIFINVVRYIFNPTINKKAGLLQYHIPTIYEDEDSKTLKDILAYKNEPITFITLNEKHFDKLNGDFDVIASDNWTELMKHDNYMIVIEYGETRYKNFEKIYQNLQNLNKKIVGIVAYKL